MMLEDLEGQLQESTQQQEEAEAELEAVRAQLRQAQGAAAAAGAVGVGAIGAAAATNVASSRKVCAAVLCCAWAGARQVDEHMLSSVSLNRFSEF